MQIFHYDILSIPFNFRYSEAIENHFGSEFIAKKTLVNEN